MALPLTGTITSAMILTELGFTGSGNVLRNVVQKPGGVLQVLVNTTWVNLNMCSPYLPTEVGPYIVPTHWYGYNHLTTGVENIVISGDTTIDIGQSVTYTATLSGDNLTGVILRWSKFEAGAWNDNIGTGNSLTVIWTDPRDAKIRVVASNICNLNTFTKELNISYNCLPALTGDPYIGGTINVGQTYDVYAVNSNGVVGSGTNTRLGVTFFWELFGSVELISGQGTNKIVIRPTGVSTNLVARLTITSCGVSNVSSNISFSSSSPVTYYYNTQQSASIQKICPSGQIGSYVTVIRAAGTHSSTVSVADANTQAIAWLSSQDAQNVAQVQGNCGNTPTYGNERRSQSFTRNNCTSGVGTSVEYVVPPNSYFSSSVGAANTLADNEIAANGQSKANSEGQCIVGCNRIVSGIGVSVSTGTGYIDAIPSASVSQTGFYTVTVSFNGYSTTVTRNFDQYNGYNSSNVVRLQCSGSGQVTVVISSECSSFTYTLGDTYTVTGAPQCITVTSISITPVRNAFLNGIAQFAVNISPIGAGILNGNFTFLGVSYSISNADFTGGFTQYLSFTTNVTGTGVVTITLSGGNMCNSSITATTAIGVYIVAPS